MNTSPPSGGDGEELPSSELGTKNYWDSAYDRELENWESNGALWSHQCGDPGEIWFGEDSMYRMMRWMDKNEHLFGGKEKAKILDIGCGNGIFSIELFNEGYLNVSGVDYSEKAIQLARKISSKHDLNISFRVMDICQSELSTEFRFDFVIDKGTYDAISLCPDNSKEMRNKYIRNVSEILLKSEGYLGLTSCNWTKEEIGTQFKEHFTVFHVIPTPSFTFGGKSGNMTTSVILKNKPS